MGNVIMFRKDWYEALEEFSPEEKLAALEATIRYAFYGERPKNKITRAATAIIFKSIDGDKERWESIREKRRNAGRIGAERRWHSGKKNADEMRAGQKKAETSPAQADTRPATEPPPIDCNDVMSRFNDIMSGKGIPAITRLTERRRAAVLARAKEFDADAVYSVIRAAAESDFLNGKNSRKWKADFDWLFKPNNFPKVLEGNYAHTTQPQSEIEQTQDNNGRENTPINRIYTDPTLRAEQTRLAQEQRLALRIKQLADEDERRRSRGAP